VLLASFTISLRLLNVNTSQYAHSTALPQRRLHHPKRDLVPPPLRLAYTLPTHASFNSSAEERTKWKTLSRRAVMMELPSNPAPLRKSRWNCPRTLTQPTGKFFPPLFLNLDLQRILQDPSFSVLPQHSRTDTAMHTTTDRTGRRNHTTRDSLRGRRCTSNSVVSGYRSFPAWDGASHPRDPTRQNILIAPEVVPMAREGL
jgi:hypothetical protein